MSEESVKWEMFAMSADVILVWTYREAPQVFKDMSTHGGDEDWVALVPNGQNWPSWADDGTPFGCCDVECHELECGGFVLIGAHA